MTIDEYLILIFRIWCFALILQAFEFIALRSRLQFSKGWNVVSLIQIVFAMAVGVRGDIAAAPVLLVLHLARLQKLGGIFNGGSDYMITTIGLGLQISARGGPLQKIGIGYIAVQTCLSYLSAGIGKAMFKEWWSGKSLREFLKTSQVRQGILIKNGFLLLSTSVILWELLFPFQFFVPRLGPIFIASAVLFHLLVFYFFGLNRFFWAWVAALPAVFYFVT